MSVRPSDKRRARQQIERPWYIRPITWKVIAIVAKALAWIIYHI